MGCSPSREFARDKKNLDILDLTRKQSQESTDASTNSPPLTCHALMAQRSSLYKRRQQGSQQRPVRGEVVSRSEPSGSVHSKSYRLPPISETRPHSFRRTQSTVSLDHRTYKGHRSNSYSSAAVSLTLVS